MNRPQKLYLETFGITVILLALVRCAFPSIADSLSKKDTLQDTLTVEQTDRSVSPKAEDATTSPESNVHIWSPIQRTKPTTNYYEVGKKHPIVGVLSYSKTFPDSNDVHMADAKRFGVKIVRDRGEAEQRKAELVYVGTSPFYHMGTLKKSIPYLVPRAAVLLNDIGRNFFDSLYVKHIPLHQIVITSVLRTEEDVENLKKVNRNTSENSCHLYGTTFDIGYNRYMTVPAIDGRPLREVGNDTLKWVLSEVLRDLRQEGRCHVKYEVKQGCFHITVK